MVYRLIDSSSLRIEMFWKLKLDQNWVWLECFCGCIPEPTIVNILWVTSKLFSVVNIQSKSTCCELWNVKCDCKYIHVNRIIIMVPLVLVCSRMYLWRRIWKEVNIHFSSQFNFPLLFLLWIIKLSFIHSRDTIIIIIAIYSCSSYLNIHKQNKTNKTKNATKQCELWMQQCKLLFSLHTVANIYEYELLYNFWWSFLLSCLETILLSQSFLIFFQFQECIFCRSLFNSLVRFPYT